MKESQLSFLNLLCLLLDCQLSIFNQFPLPQEKEDVPVEMSNGEPGCHYFEQLCYNDMWLKVGDCVFIKSHGLVRPRVGRWVLLKQGGCSWVWEIWVEIHHSLEWSQSHCHHPLDNAVTSPASSHTFTLLLSLATLPSLNPSVNFSFFLLPFTEFLTQESPCVPHMMNSFSLT